MDTPKAQTIIVTVGLGVAALAVVDAARTGQRPEARRIIATGLGTLGLSAVANVAPGVAGPMALLWGASALIVSGGPTLATVTKAIRPASSSSSAPAPYAGGLV